MTKVSNLEGETFGRLTVLSRDYTRIKGGPYYWCECSCGNKPKKSIWGYNLVSGHSKSCGCLQKEYASNCPNMNIKQYNTYDLSGEYGIGYTSKDEEFYFDLEDYDKIKNICWCMGNDGYIISSFDSKGNKKATSMHRVIMNIADKNMKVDHIYHINYDNRKSHLRITTNQQNSMNQSLSKNNTSGVTGVWFDNNSGKWRACVNINKKQTALGSFNNFEDAVKARKEAENKYYGEYSYDNSMKLNKNHSYTKEEEC